MCKELYLIFTNVSIFSTICYTVFYCKVVIVIVLIVTYLLIFFFYSFDCVDWYKFS